MARCAEIPYFRAMTGKKFTSLDWDDLRSFEALARAGTFLGAAKLLGVEHATVSRRVAALEATLERKLIDRRDRRISLTTEGEHVARYARQMAIQTAAIEQLARSSQTELQGHVRISAPPGLSAAVLAKPIVDVQRKHPGIRITLLGEKRVASLDKREADIAVRLSRPEDGDYAVMKMGAIRFHLYASETYLATVAPANWTFIAYDDEMNAAPQQVLLREIAAERPISLRSSDLAFQIAAARLGAGVVMLPEFAATPLGDLRRIQAPVSLEREIWLVVHADIRHVPAVRAVLDVLKQAVTWDIG
jgi:DNA-binding transcriptional LysR family regulator